MYDFRKYGIDTCGRTSGKIKCRCPQCHEQRSDKRDKSLSVNLTLGLAYCHYCNWTVKVPDNAAAKYQKQEAPITHEAHLDDKVVRWFKDQRGISASTLMAAGVTSAEQFMPQTKSKALCAAFNYYHEKRVVNVKYRDIAAKHFRMVAGAEMIPYNINAVAGEPTCVIVEGEIDALSFVEAGVESVVSVPAGANTNLGWLDDFVDSHFADKETIYICTDNDPKGKTLAQELIRRLGADRCAKVDLMQYKDANEALLGAGKEFLTDAINNAEPVELEGVFTASSVREEMGIIFRNGLGKAADTGWENLDKICSFEPGRLMVVTGIPGSGKSEFVDELVLRLALRHEWKAAFFSPENQPISLHYTKLCEKLAGRQFREGMISTDMYDRLLAFTDEYITTINPSENFTADHILDTARALIRRKGIRILVLDPLNYVDHLMDKGDTETEYMNKLLNRLVFFARATRCLVILVAHPRKMYRVPGSLHVPTPDLYDIAGSAAFYNKADYGMVVDRDYKRGCTRVNVEKVRFRHQGEKGVAVFKYNIFNGRYQPADFELDGSNNVAFVEEVVHDIDPWIGRSYAMSDLYGEHTDSRNNLPF